MKLNLRRTKKKDVVGRLGGYQGLVSRIKSVKENEVVSKYLEDNSNDQDAINSVIIAVCVFLSLSPYLSGFPSGSGTGQRIRKGEIVKGEKIAAKTTIRRLIG